MDRDHRLGKHAVLALNQLVGIDEFQTCWSGELTLTAGNQSFTLPPQSGPFGDMLAGHTPIVASMARLVRSIGNLSPPAPRSQVPPGQYHLPFCE